MTPLSPWLGPKPLLLASTSPTRRALLEGAGLPVETEAPEVDERAVEAASAGLAPADLARRLAEAKVLAVARRHPDRLVLGADQVLALGATVFHKPADADAARDQIARLAGRTHQLHAAYALAHGGAVVAAGVETASLTVRPLDERQIAAYVTCAGEARVRASVGGYQLEGLGIHLFEAVAGEHSTILGLPLLPLLAHLRADGWLRF
ncbi:Maf family protein [Methylobacterium gregans]|uniref:Nucleoside triphosphate pyrophosphatase n=1 Tax=Methylobacterium gregans TaxID=374424 RepID=A0AA37HMH2_9HYPH|nr:Maf family protein [Methylobacterium gregans]MDQ0519862.1 septum formation protein [Methylobacterium gregans]GJD77557.1 7-methyl-GTP pyrophosphatase [Methylobacterium gregans]GLS54018.1 Maf-like protein [Methylobacterium gregans]